MNIVNFAGSAHHALNDVRSQTTTKPRYGGRLAGIVEALSPHFRPLQRRLDGTASTRAGHRHLARKEQRFPDTAL